MELAKIESLLEVYFEGKTTLEEERSLRAYFIGEEVAPHLLPYRSLFQSFELAKQEVAQREFKLPVQESNTPKWWYGIAASAVIAIAVAGFVFQEPGLTSEEKEALVAYQQSKEAMVMLSNKLNKATEELTYIHEINKTKKRILK